MPIAEVPFVVRGETIALFALTCVLFANFAVGGPSIAVFSHWWSLRTGRRRYDRFAYGLAQVLVAFFGVVAALAVFLVFLLTVLWPGGWLRIMALYFRPLAMLAVLLLAEVGLLGYYVHTWWRPWTRRELHPVVGAAAVLVGLGSLLVVNSTLAGIFAALPYAYTTGGSGLEILVDGFALWPADNPTWLSRILFHTAGAVSFSGLVIATVVAIRQIRGRSFEDREYGRWATGYALRLALSPLLALPLLGLLFLSQAPGAAPADLLAVVQGDLRWAFNVEIGLLAALFLLGSWYLVRRLSFAAPRGSGARMARHWTYAAGMAALAIGALLAWQESSQEVRPDWENWSVVAALVLLYAAGFALLQHMEDAATADPRQDWARHAGALLPILGLCTAAIALPLNRLSLGGLSPGEMWRYTAMIGVSTLVTPIGMMYLKARSFGLLERWPHYSRLVPALAGLAALCTLFVLGYARDLAVTSYVAFRQFSTGSEVFAQAMPALPVPLPVTSMLWLITFALLACAVLAWLVVSESRRQALATVPRPSSEQDKQSKAA